MAKKPTRTIPAAKLALYEKLIASDPSIQRKGATIPYTSANGKMFTYLSPTGDLRLGFLRTTARRSGRNTRRAWWSSTVWS